jgi:hypothetical protein
MLGYTLHHLGADLKMWATNNLVAKAAFPGASLPDDGEYCRHLQVSIALLFF